MEVVDIGLMSVYEFLKQNKINPKIYTSDQLSTRTTENKREYYL